MTQSFADRFELLRPLGAGGMGDVFLALDTWRPGAHVALKRAAAGDAAATDALAREFTALRLLRHPGIAAVREYGSCPQTRQAYFTMDVAGATDAAEAARAGSVRDAVDIVASACEALAFVHSRGFVHGDVKAANILVAREAGQARACLVDFGLARPAGEPGSSAFSGTLTHAAPEVLAGAAADPRADLYSLGVTLFHLLAGRLPFEDADALALAAAHRERDAPALRDLRPDIPEALSALVRRLLAKEPSRRPQAAHAVIGALRECVTTLREEPEDSRQAWARAPRLIGREEAVRSADELLARACDPSRRGSRALLIAGEEGSGKSRLLDGAAERAQICGARALRGVPTGEPWSILAGPLVDALRIAGAGGPGTSSRPAVLALVEPSLASPDSPLPVGLSADDVRLAVGRATWDALAAAATKPLLLVLDDIDRCDAESRWLVAFLLRQLGLQDGRGGRLPFAVLAAGHASRAEGDLAFMAECPARVDLAPLDAAQTGELVASMFPGCEEGARLAEVLVHGVGSQPRLIEGWCAELVRARALRPTSAGWTFEEKHPACRSPPRDLAAALTQAVADLPAASRDVLLDLALLPVGVELAELAAARGVDARLLAASMDGLQRREMALAPARPDGRIVAIASEGLRQVTLAAVDSDTRRARAAELLAAPGLARVLAPADRARLAELAGQIELARELVATALGAATAREDHARAARLAEHLAEITSGRDRRAAWRAAGNALIALERLDDAQRALEQAGREAGDEERAEQAALEGRLELRRGRASRAAELFGLALEQAPPGLRAATLADWRLDQARAASAAGLPGAEALLDALGASAGENLEGARILIARGAHQLRAQRTSEARETLERAASLARGAGGALEEASCENNLGVAALRVDDRDAAARHLHRSIEIRLARGARGAAAGALMNLVLLELDRRRAGPALKSARECLRVHEDVGSVRGQLLARINMAVAHALREDWSACDAELRRAIDLEPQASDPHARSVRLLVGAELARAVGRPEQAIRLAREAVAAEGGASPSLRLSALTVAASCGDERALADLAAVMDGDEDADATAPRGEGSPSLPVERTLEARCVLAGCFLRGATWTNPLAAAAGADVVRARAWAFAAFGAARTQRSPELLAARLALALVEASAGAEDRADELLAEVSPREERAARPSARAVLAAARGWSAARAGNLAAAERFLERGVELARTQVRRVPTPDRDAFLASEPWRGLREGLLGIRRRRLDEETQGAFFGVLTAAGRGAAATRGHGQGVDRALEAAVRAAERRAERLGEILLISRGINALRPVGELLESTLRSAMSFMDADRGFIVLCSGGALDLAVARDREGRDVARAEFAISRSVLDEVIRTKVALLSADARADERFVRGASVLALDLRSVLVAPLVAREEVIGAIYLDNRHASGAFDEADRDLLAILATQAAVAVENARLHVASVEKERMENELSIASAIQQGLLPRELPGTRAFRVAAAMEPAREIGGDYYDFIEASDGRLRVAIGDVSGKGVAAGLFMVMARSILRSLAASPASLDRVLAEANDALESQSQADQFMTMLLMEPASDGRSIRICLAGHEPPLAWRRERGSIEWLADGGRALGMLPGLGPLLQERVIAMSPGDVLTCYSDGVTEAVSSTGERFGRGRLEAAVAASASSGAQSVLDGVLSAVARFRGAAPRFDDITLVILEARA